VTNGSRVGRQAREGEQPAEDKASAAIRSQHTRTTLHVSVEFCFEFLQLCFLLVHPGQQLLAVRDLFLKVGPILLEQLPRLILR
jgi:hypothetical protein